jgi:hypothetical protein
MYRHYYCQHSLLRIDHTKQKQHNQKAAVQKMKLTLGSLAEKETTEKGGCGEAREHYGSQS